KGKAQVVPLLELAVRIAGVEADPDHLGTALLEVVDAAVERAGLDGAPGGVVLGIEVDEHEESPQLGEPDGAPVGTASLEVGCRGTGRQQSHGWSPFLSAPGGCAAVMVPPFRRRSRRAARGGRAAPIPRATASPRRRIVAVPSTAVRRHPRRRRPPHRPRRRGARGCRESAAGASRAAPSAPPARACGGEARDLAPAAQSSPRGDPPPAGPADRESRDGRRPRSWEGWRRAAASRPCPRPRAQLRPLVTISLPPSPRSPRRAETAAEPGTRCSPV